MAFEILDDYGDASAGEWTEDRPRAFHLRRRLSAQEQEIVGDAVDCRETDEGVKRFQAIKSVLPKQCYTLVAEELGASWVEL